MNEMNDLGMAMFATLLIAVTLVGGQLYLADDERLAFDQQPVGYKIVQVNE